MVTETDDENEEGEPNLQNPDSGGLSHNSQNGKKKEESDDKPNQQPIPIETASGEDVVAQMSVLAPPTAEKSPQLASFLI